MSRAGKALNRTFFMTPYLAQRTQLRSLQQCRRTLSKQRPLFPLNGIHARHFGTSAHRNLPTGKALINSVGIHYERTGNSSEAVLCMPGALGTARTDFGPQLEGLAESFTVVAYDPRGYGASRPPKRDFPLDFYHRDAMDGAALMKHLGYHQFHLLGWSDGGICAQILAGTNPEMVKKLVIWGTQAFLAQKDIQLVEPSRDLSKWSEKMRAPLEAIYGKEGLKTIWNAWMDGFFQFQHCHEWNICKEFLPKISCPTLILHGRKDPLVPGLHPKYLLKNIKNAEYYEFENGKHNIHLRYHQEFNKLVTDFLLKK